MNTLLTVDRYEFNPDWTIGELLLQGIKDGYTVEDEIRTVKVKGETAIPYGKYLLGYRQSPKFSTTFVYSDKYNFLCDYRETHKYPDIKDWRPHDLIWIKDVPNFEYVLIHWGNNDDNTDGCLIVGTKPGFTGTQKGVLMSRSYYKQLYPKIYPLIKQGNQYIEYKSKITA